MSYEFCGMVIPSYMEKGMYDYIKYGIEPGGFLRSVLANDLKEAVGKADDCNIKIIPAYVSYLYNKAPSSCWGSPEKVVNWMKDKREQRTLEAQKNG